MCYETSKDDVFLCFGNRECYDGGVLEIMPHSDFLDLLVTYRKRVEISDKVVSMPYFITDMQYGGMDENSLFDTAKNNTERCEKPVLYSLAKVVCNLTGGPRADNLLDSGDLSAEDEQGLYVLSNEGNNRGAVMIMFDSVMERVAEKVGENFFVLPSSIHEVIIVKDNGECNVEGLKSMVMEINSTTVSTSDKLSDSIYYYNNAEKELRRIA